MNQRFESGPRGGCGACVSRRRFMAAGGAAVLGAALAGCAGRTAAASSQERRIRPMGPASKYTPLVHAAFVRRKGEYGMRWPGAVFDGEAARRDIAQKTEAAAKGLGLRLVLRPEPVYSKEEAEAWVSQAAAEKADGLFVVLLDRQEHAWPTAARAVESRIPTVVFAPVGAAFTTNTAPLAAKTGAFLCSTDDFSRAAFGLRMLGAGARLREMRYVVIQGTERRDSELPHFGTKIRRIPAAGFLEEYLRTPVTDEVQSIADDYMGRATRLVMTGRQDVVNGVKSYVVARSILEREEGDGITMDCLGALGKSQVSLPCIAWSRMLDHNIPAACEADLGPAVTHAIVQSLFDRPGFQQDPVPDTGDGTLIGAHCSCPTRLKGYAEAPETFYLSCHHGKRDAVPRTVWREGQRMTSVVVGLGKDKAPPHMVISSGTVVGNVSVPPAGGCVVSVKVRLDGVDDLLAYPGFHQLFVYGDFKRELKAYCQLFGIEARVV